jgi:hypothetical protein
MHGLTTNEDFKVSPSNDKLPDNIIEFKLQRRTCVVGCQYGVIPVYCCAINHPTNRKVVSCATFLINSALSEY